MKRLSLIIVTAAMIGKLFSVVMVHFAESSDKASHNLGRNLFFEKETDSQLRLSDIPSNLDIAKHAQQKGLPVMGFNAQPFQVKQPLVAKTVAKVADKAKDDDNKEKERRKKRRKNLEEKTAVSTPPAVQPPPLAPNTSSESQVPSNYNTYVALPIPGKTGPINAANVTGAVATTTPVATLNANKVSTLSTATVNAWIKLLTTSPSVAAMTSFESQYSSRLISQAQYYQVLTAMTASTNTEARNLSVQAATLYQTIYSFKILADESQTETDPTVKALAVAGINKYDVAADVSILTVANTSGDSAEKLWAEQFLKTLGATSTASTNAVSSTTPSTL